MPSKWTFEVAPLRDLVLRHKRAGETWLDPFAGFNSPAEVTNDLNEAAPTIFHLEANEFCKRLAGEQFDGAIFDPPYSLTQVSRSYQELGLKFYGRKNPTGSFPDVRDRLARLIRSRGMCVSFGWNSCGLGKKRGFEIVELLVCCHGGNRNDTIGTVERRIE